MTTPQSDLWRAQYLKAAAHANAERFEAGIKAAKDNLSDLALSRYWRMKNLLLVANATEDWYEAERCRHAVDHLWNITNSMTTEEELSGQRALRELRESLDMLIANQEAQKPDEVDLDMLYPDEDEDEEVEEGQEVVPRKVVMLERLIDLAARRIEKESVAAAIARAEQERADPNDVGFHSGMPVVEYAPWYRAPEAAPIVPAPEPPPDPPQPPLSSDPHHIETTIPPTPPQTSPKGGA